MSGWPSPLRPGGLPTLNAGYFAGLIDEDPVALASLLDVATDRYREAARAAGATTICRFHLGLELDVVTVSALLSNEILMHGWDIARATDRPFGDDVAALTTLLAIAPMAAALVDPEILGTDARIGFAPHGHLRYAYQLGADGATYLPAAGGLNCDGVVEGRPFAMLLWLTGRLAWHDAELAATGPKSEIARVFRQLRF